MQNIDELLNETARFFETTLNEDERLQLHLGGLIDHGMSPHVTRPLRDLPDAELMIVVRKTPK